MIKQAVFSLALSTVLVAQQTPKPKERDLEIVSTVKPAAVQKFAGIPRSYALVIGVGKYPYLKKEQQLPFAEPDAESMFNILISREGGNFRFENVHRLIGADASLANIRKELEVWLPSVAEDGDRVLVYFAGHGFVADGKGFLAPADVRPSDLKKTGYPMDQLGSVFAGRIKGKWKVLLTDSCHSGAITPSEIGAINKSMIDLDKSLFVMTASRDREVANESADFGGGHGVFTYFVERGMGGAADENGDGIVTADELAEYVRTNVRKATGGKQNPTSDKGSFDPNMLLAYVPALVKPDAPPAPKQGTMVLETNMDGVEVFVDGQSVGVLKKGTSLRLPGLKPGPHTVRGVKIGYADDGPREETIYPGLESTVTVRIQFRKQPKKAAVEELDRGLKYYRDGGENNYKKAAESFSKALKLDSEYSQAALYLGLARNALFDNEGAEAAFKKAIALQPDYLAARLGYAGMLFDIGNMDESVNQLRAVLQRDKDSGEAYYKLSRAYRMKQDFEQAMVAAQKAVQLLPAKAEPHFYLAESLRFKQRWDESKKEYLEYLRMSDFDSKLAGKLDFYVKGFLIGGGKKRRPSQDDIWREMRSEAYFGICESDQKMKRLDDAISNCQKAIRYDPKDPFTNQKLGITYARKYEQTVQLEDLASASKYLKTMIQLGPDLEDAKNARTMIASFDQALQQAAAAKSK